MRNQGETVDKVSIVVSAVAHVVGLGVAWLATLDRAPQIEFESIQVVLVSPAPPQPDEEERQSAEEVVVERPDPVVPEPEPEPDLQPEVELAADPPPDPDPAPEPEPVDQVADEPEAATAVIEEDSTDSDEVGEDSNVRLEGLKRLYPEYYQNIIRQIDRCFRGPAEGSWEATVQFVIERDGLVADARLSSRSGNSAFDFQAMRAVVDCAGKGRFGPLPEALPYDRLPISFDFKPSGALVEPYGGGPEGEFPSP